MSGHVPFFKGKDVPKVELDETADPATKFPGYRAMALNGFRLGLQGHQLQKEQLAAIRAVLAELKKLNATMDALVPVFRGLNVDDKTTYTVAMPDENLGTGGD